MPKFPDCGFTRSWFAEAAFVADVTHWPNRSSAVPSEISAVTASGTPASLAMSAISSFVRPDVPSSGWPANICSLNTGNASGACSATRAAAEAARVEKPVPFEYRFRMAIGWYTIVACPSEARETRFSPFVCSNAPHAGHM